MGKPIGYNPARLQRAASTPAKKVFSRQSSVFSRFLPWAERMSGRAFFGSGRLPLRQTRILFDIFLWGWLDFV